MTFGSTPCARSPSMRRPPGRSRSSSSSFSRSPAPKVSATDAGAAKRRSHRPVRAGGFRRPGGSPAKRRHAALRCRPWPSRPARAVECRAEQPAHRRGRDQRNRGPRRRRPGRPFTRHPDRGEFGCGKCFRTISGERTAHFFDRRKSAWSSAARRSFAISSSSPRTVTRILLPKPRRISPKRS